MRQLNPRTMILLGFVLVLFGFIIPFLMVVRVIKAGFFLSFLSYGASMAGLFLGLIGAAWYSRRDRR